MTKECDQKYLFTNKKVQNHDFLEDISPNTLFLAIVA